MCGVKPQNLNSIFDVNTKSLKKDNSIVIPFIPINFFDETIELNKANYLTHSLILFNYYNCLYVFIDLFNTFQYYILLSDKYDDNLIYNNYCQSLQKREFDKDVVKKELMIQSYKDAHGFYQE